MNLLSIEVIAPVLTELYHCLHCETIFAQVGLGRKVHGEQINEYPEDIKEDFLHLSNWLRELAHRYEDTVRIRLIDVQSFEGFLKSMRYWVRRHPAFIINGRKEYVGWDETALDRLLVAHMNERSSLG